MTRYRHTDDPEFEFPDDPQQQAEMMDAYAKGFYEGLRDTYERYQNYAPGYEPRD